MVVNLQEIRTAVLTYVDTKVTCSVSAIIPDVPIALSPSEGFTFNVTVSNAAVAAGGIRLTNVRYVISASSSNVKLIVPPVTVGNARVIGLLPLALNPGTETSGYILTPPAGDLKILDPGETDTITGLKGIAKSLGAFSVCFHILADIDLDFLFPQDAPSVNGCKPGNVV